MGDWQPENNKLTNTSISKSKPATIAIGADLSALPAYAQDTNYLKKNLLLDKKNIDYRIISILIPENINKAELKKNELDALSKSSHIFIIEVSDIYKSNAEMKISLPLQYDTSYRSISIMDDRNLKDISGKTFAFEHLVDGGTGSLSKSQPGFYFDYYPHKKINMFKTLYELLTGTNADPIYSTDVYPSVGLFTLLFALISALIFYLALGRWKPVWDKLIHWVITLIVVAAVAFYFALTQAKGATGEDADAFMYKFSLVNVLYASIYLIIFSILMKKASIFAKHTPF